MKIGQLGIAITLAAASAAGRQTPNAPAVGNNSSVQGISPLPQTAASSRSESPTVQPSDPRAVAIVERAIKAMGGRGAWQGVGGSIAEVVIGSSSIPERHVKWTDDWSTGRVRMRRDSGGNEQAKSSIVASENAKIRLQANGKPSVLLRDNGIALLAASNPAEALILSISRYSCNFEVGRPANPRLPLSSNNQDETIITERCPDLHYPTGIAIFYWTFSITGGLPRSVELPTWGQTHHIIRYEIINFDRFQTTQGRLSPLRLQIRRMSGSLNTVTINQTQFVESVPSKVFNLGN